MDDCTGHFGECPATFNLVHSLCATCLYLFQELHSAFTGYIKLELPVFHIGYFKTMMKTLQCICKSCSKVLLLPDDRQRFLKYVVAPNNARCAGR